MAESRLQDKKDDDDKHLCHQRMPKQNELKLWKEKSSDSLLIDTSNKFNILLKAQYFIQKILQQ